MLKTVRTPSSRRGPAAYFIAGWKACANMKPKPSLADASRNLVWFEIDLRTERLEDVC